MAPVKVSVIIPCYNEERTIEELLNAILAQTYPVDSLEVIIADGLSTDHTRERIAAFKTGHPQLEVRVVDNIQQTIPAALNQAIAESSGEILARMDAHAIPVPDYIERCVESLLAGYGENVGGVIDIKPGKDDWIGHAIAVATAHPWGWETLVTDGRKKPAQQILLHLALTDARSLTASVVMRNPCASTRIMNSTPAFDVRAAGFGSILPSGWVIIHGRISSHLRGNTLPMVFGSSGCCSATLKRCAGGRRFHLFSYQGF